MMYALGRRIEYYDMPTIRAIARGAGRNDDHVPRSSWVFVNSGAFQMTRIGRDGNGRAEALACVRRSGFSGP